MWRGGVHPWKTIDRQTIVCADFASQVHTLAPFLVGGEATDTLFEMLIFGIRLRVGINHPEKEFYAPTCTHTPDSVIIAANCKSATETAVEDFHKKARHAENVKRSKRRSKRGNEVSSYGLHQ